MNGIVEGNRKSTANVNNGTNKLLELLFSSFFCSPRAQLDDFCFENISLAIWVSTKFDDSATLARASGDRKSFKNPILVDN